MKQLVQVKIENEFHELKKLSNISAAQGLRWKHHCALKPFSINARTVLWFQNGNYYRGDKHFDLF